VSPNEYSFGLTALAFRDGEIGFVATEVDEAELRRKLQGLKGELLLRAMPDGDVEALCNSCHVRLVVAQKDQLYWFRCPRCHGISFDPTPNVNRDVQFANQDGKAFEHQTNYIRPLPPGIDDLGKDAPDGIEDPVLFKESDWFNNDAFWWNANATDWAYNSPWIGEKVADHPVYTPVHRYARNIIVSLDHWMTGWVDWNIVLDARGGPNHVGNFCGAPIMIDTDTGNVYYTPIHHVLAQFSRTIRPGDKAVQTHKTLDGLDADAVHACPTINADQLLSVQLLNTSKEVLTISLQIGGQFAELQVPQNSVQTVRIQL